MRCGTGSSRSEGERTPFTTLAPLVGFAALLWLGCGEGAVAPERPDEAAAPPLILVTEDPSDAPISGLCPEWLARFARGDARFELPFRAAQGLGPLYIQHSCESCHEGDSRGPSVVTRLALLHGDRSTVLPFGDVVRRRTIGGATPLLPAADAPVRAETRLGPPLFGRGYIEAIADDTLLSWERAQAERDDGISGRAHRVERASAVALPSWLPALGRFGLKARLASLDEFVADALVGDMGLTSPFRPTEPANPDGLLDDDRPGVDVDLGQVAAITDYVRLLAIPGRESADPAGGALFEDLRCSVCHVPRARTRSDHPIAALAGVDVALYTDLLLHDMGAGLADGIIEGQASGREWQTPALMGIRHQRRLLHDGRAEGVEQAIEAHASEGSEANDAVARFRALSSADRARVVAFVEAL